MSDTNKTRESALNAERTQVNKTTDAAPEYCKTDDFESDCYTDSYGTDCDDDAELRLMATFPECQCYDVEDSSMSALAGGLVAGGVVAFFALGIICSVTLVGFGYLVSPSTDHALCVAAAGFVYVSVRALSETRSLHLPLQLTT